MLTALRQIFVLIFLILLPLPCAAQSSLGSGVTEAPFSLQNGFLIVEATIKGNITVQVALATGTEHSMTDPALLDKYKLKAYYTADGPVTGRNDKTFTFTQVSEVRVANSKSKNLNMRLGSMSSLSRMAGREIFGLLGADFFEGQIVQLDFKNKVIRFKDKVLDDLVNSKNPNASSRSVVLRMAAKPTDPFRKRFLIPLVREVQFNGQKANLLIDTGVASPLAFSSSAARKIGLNVPTENDREEKVTVRFESYEMIDVPAWVYAKGTSADQMLDSYGVVAGALFLQEFVVLFDYKKGLVVLERP